MRDAAPKPIRLADYRPPAYRVDDVHLTFRLDPRATRVVSRIRFYPDPDAPGPFVLHGERLRLIRAAIDGREVTPEMTEDGLTCPVPDGPFTWEAEVEIDPEGNTALEGLYLSRGMYCTQCEAHGFRRITFFPDRPDVLAVYTVRIESNLPVLLSNGDPVASGPGWAEWHDPWPKPAYLFALVAGELAAVRDSFTTASGREVALAVWVRPGDEDRCGFALEALKASMRWDEEVYGREYDLGQFNIVAVDDFNMGAMENKGLNIFNSSAVLANAETATDANFERIEGIIAHEYFHNWTGNRVTCRDWFQLSLKEGLTVFRDQQFSADMRGAGVKRIADVVTLRHRQFREDDGPLAHPVRPREVVEINNFYTATIYEKGAEVIRMLHLLVGPEGYRRALDLYFDRHDGQAATIDDWLKVFEDVTGRDLGRFARWYDQAGTPRLRMDEAWQDGRLTLTFRQHTRPTPGQPDKSPLVLPIAVGLIDRQGREMRRTALLEMTEAEQSFAFEGLAERPVVSVLRGFSAPVVLERDLSAADAAHLLAHDTDDFARWEAGRSLARRTLAAMATAGAAPDPALVEAVGRVVRDEALDPAFRALAADLPGEDDVARMIHDDGGVPDPDAIHDTREALRHALAAHLAPDLDRLDATLVIDAPYAPDADQVGKRALAARLLAFRTCLDGGAAAQAQFDAGRNMTEIVAALTCLVRAGAAEAALDAFYARWSGDRLVLDKWFALQIADAPAREAADIARKLTEHPDFTWKVPNRFRAVLGTLAGHPSGFHRADGAGYALLADWIVRLDPVNPQTAARITAAFETWRRYDAGRQAQARKALERIAETPDLSPDTGEMVDRILTP